jgi:peptide methionine sulfoxide reductase MsrB
MLYMSSPGALKGVTKQTVAWFVAFVVALSGLAPLMLSGQASAAELTSRKATISTSVTASTDVEFAFSYSIPNTAAAKQGIIYQFCTTPLGSCTLPTGMSVQAATHDAQTGWPSNGTAFTAHAVTDENDCDMSTTNSKMCFERTSATTGGGAVTHTISGITAPSSQQTVYIRIAIYSDNDFQTVDRLDDGTVAVAFNDQLTVNGRVQERLAFCIAAIDDAAALPADVATCSALTTTVVDIGVIDNSLVVKAPVDDNPPTSLGNDDYGIAMVNTNASNGVSITFFSEQAGSGTNQLRAFRVTGATCNASAATLTDQCFRSAAGDTSGGTAVTAGNEYFGMNIPCIDTTQGSTVNLVADTDFDGDGTTTSAANCENTDTNTTFAWNDTSTATEIATSAGSSVKVVDDEIVKLAFGASAEATTPTGAYTVVSTYIATPTF